MSSKVTVFDVLVYSPTGLGLLILLLAVFFLWRPLSFIITCGVASLLHLGTFLMVRGFVAYGEAWSGQGSQHHLPQQVLEIGFELIGALIAIKILLVLGYYFYLRRTGRIKARPASPAVRYDY